jgi:hypothetical protein
MPVQLPVGIVGQRARYLITEIHRYLLGQCARGFGKLSRADGTNPDRRNLVERHRPWHHRKAWKASSKSRPSLVDHDILRHEPLYENVSDQQIEPIAE